MIRALLALALAFAATAPLAAPRVTHVDPPHHVLFIGNSFSYYNDSLHGHLRHLVLAADPEHAKEYVFRSSTISGAYLMEHAGDLPYELQSRHWDVVVLQGQSREPMASDAAKAERFRQAARGFDGLIKASGAKAAFFMSNSEYAGPVLGHATRTMPSTCQSSLNLLVWPPRPLLDTRVFRQAVRATRLQRT